MKSICKICGVETSFFTDTINPENMERKVVYLCREHQIGVFRSMMGYIRDKRVERIENDMDVPQED